jgi:phosphohistidine phosphatase
MPIFLVRHGTATSELMDPTQPLSARGRDEVERVARYLATIGVSVAEVRHSTKLRARETAEILAQHLPPARGLAEVDWLAPMGDPGMAEDGVEAAADPLMLVGHLPHLARLASLLLTGNSNRQVVRFPNAAVACLEKVEDAWVLLWFLTPDLVPPVP